MSVEAVQLSVIWVDEVVEALKLVGVDGGVVSPPPPLEEVVPLAVLE